MKLGNTLIFGKDLLGPAHRTVQYNPTPIWARGHQAVYAGPRPRVPSCTCPRERANAAVARSAACHLAPMLPTSPPPPLPAPRMHPPPPHACRAFIPCVAATPGPSSFLFPLHLPQLLCCRSNSPSPPIPTNCHCPNRGTRPPPAPPRAKDLRPWS
jgi:hypothetical protein